MLKSWFKTFDPNLVPSASFSYKRKANKGEVDLIQNKKTESTERRKTSFPKEKVENTDIHKPV